MDALREGARVVEKQLYLAHSLTTGNIGTNSSEYKDSFGYGFLSLFYKAFCDTPLCLRAFQGGNQGI